MNLVDICKNNRQFIFSDLESNKVTQYTLLLLSYIHVHESNNLIIPIEAVQQYEENKGKLSKILPNFVVKTDSILPTTAQ